MWIFNAFAISVLAYSRWVWIMEHPKAMERKLDAAEKKWLRRMLKISYRERASRMKKSEERHNIYKSVTSSREEKWNGQAMYCEDERQQNLKRIVKHTQSSNETRRGRSTRRWADIIDKGFKAIELHGMTEGREIDCWGNSQPKTENNGRMS